MLVPFMEFDDFDVTAMVASHFIENCELMLMGSFSSVEMNLVVPVVDIFCLLSPDFGEARILELVWNFMLNKVFNFIPVLEGELILLDFAV